MGADKAFASLSSGLLARKGAARPAMRPQGFGQGGNGLEDLGWNDMGFEPPKPALAPVRDESHDAFGEELTPQPLRNPLAALTPVQSPVHNQQAQIADRFAVPEDVSEDGEEFDETAELYEPDAEPNVEPDAEPAKQEDAPAEAPVEASAEAEPLTERASVQVKPASIASIIAEPVVPAAPRRMPRSRAAAGSKAKAAFTLRLDPDRHLRLRLACAVSGRSAQQLVTDAVDQLLDTMPELDAMAAKAKRKE